MSSAHRTVEVQLGYQVGRWRVEDAIASGSWGSVYGARLVSGGPDVAPGQLPEVAAIKFLPTGTLTTRQLGHLADMARRELQLREALEHPRLVRTFQTLTVDDPARPELDGAVAIVMERAADSLGGRLPGDGGGPVPDGPRLLEQVCEGLAHMHAAGWVHGDLKPTNVLIMADGTVRLADFGLAAELDGTHAYSPPAGSPDYLPPEHWTATLSDRGTPVRTTADIWAFGVTAHQVLTGRLPFPGTTPTARSTAAAAYASGSVELQLHPDLAPAWRELIEDCLAPDHESRRRHDAAALLERIRPLVAAGLPGSIRDAAADARRGPTSGRHRRRLATAALALAGVSLLAGGAAVATRSLGSDTSRSTSGAAGEFRPDLLRTGVGIPPQYRKLIVEAGTNCREPGVSPALIAAMLKVESNFDPNLSDPAKDEYGIARWTPSVLRYHLPDGQRDTVPTPPLTPEVSIPAVGRYLCFLAPRLNKDLPGDRALLLAATYRTSATKVNKAGGIPPALRAHAERVGEYLRRYTPKP